MAVYGSIMVLLEPAGAQGPPRNFASALVAQGLLGALVS